jgi:polyhydroxybutyrate depolymerase
MRLGMLPLLALPLLACGETTEELYARLVAERPYEIKIPKGYDGTPAPLVVNLHGFGDSGEIGITRTGLADLVDSRGFLLAYPDGVPVYLGFRGWNASCCDERLETDDVTYLRALIADASSRYNVDPDRIFVTGYSMGAFMSHLFACRASDLVAAISVFAGTMLAGEEAKCAPAEPVAVMDVHGTADTVVRIDGGTIDFGSGELEYISAADVVATWVALDGCDATPEASAFDAAANLSGEETAIARYGGCRSGRAVEFWRVDGGGHEISPTEGFQGAVIDFLYAHPKS